MKRLISLILVTCLISACFPFRVGAEMSLLDSDEIPNAVITDSTEYSDTSTGVRDSTIPSRAIVIIPGIMGATLKYTPTNSVVWFDYVNTISYDYLRK